MKDYSSLFKAYDIRGIRETEFDETFCYNLGWNFAQHFGKQKSVFVVGDTRIGNELMIAAFAKGLYYNGHKNFYILDDKDFVCSTSFAYAVGYQTCDLGVIFTASHNPAEYLGIKVFDKNGDIVGLEILNNFSSLKNYEKISLHSMIEKNNQNLREKILEKLDDIKLWSKNLFENIETNFSIGVDFSGGAACKYEKQILESIKNPKLKFEFVNERYDGTFGAHSSDTMQEKNYCDLIPLVEKNSLDFGVMFDGDADRAGFCLDSKVVSGDIIIKLFSEKILEKKPGANILYDLRCSREIEENIKINSGNPIKTRVGSRFIKSDMKNFSSPFGGETSGHYFFNIEKLGGFEFALYYLYLFILSAQKYGNKIFETKYKKSPEINFVVKDSKKVFEKIENQFNKPVLVRSGSNFRDEDRELKGPNNRENWDSQIEKLDGISVYTDNYWFNVRSSNTEPKMRLNLEVYNEKEYENILETLKNLFND